MNGLKDMGVDEIKVIRNSRNIGLRKANALVDGLLRDHQRMVGIGRSGCIFPSALAVIILLFIPNACKADRWLHEKELVENSFKFGDTEIIRIFDGRIHPENRVKVFYKGIEQANIKNLTFDKIKPFYGGVYFLGVSNNGISRFAYFIISRDGSLMKAVDHDNGIKYCQASITILRRWVDESVEIYEEYQKNESVNILHKVYVKACDGRKVEILSL
jgi:hypothetical protein